MNIMHQVKIKKINDLSSELTDYHHTLKSKNKSGLAIPPPTSPRFHYTGEAKESRNYQNCL